MLKVCPQVTRDLAQERTTSKRLRLQDSGYRKGIVIGVVLLTMILTVNSGSH